MERPVAFGLLAGVLIVAAVMDGRWGRVFNWLTLPAILLALIGWTAWGLIGGRGWTGLTASLLGTGAALILFTLLFAMGGLGGGDVKLMTAVGTITASWQCVLATTLYAFVIAAIMALFVMVRRRLVVQTLRRIFGLALLAAGRGAAMPKDSPRIPFAIAIALGGLLAAAEVLLDLPTPWAPFAH